MPAWSWFAFLALHNRPMTLNFRAYSFIRWCSEVFVKYFGPEPRQAQERTLWRPAARSCANSGHSGTAWRTSLFDLVSSLKSGPTIADLLRQEANPLGRAGEHEELRGPWAVPTRAIRGLGGRRSRRQPRPALIRRTSIIRHQKARPRNRPGRSRGRDGGHDQTWAWRRRRGPVG